MRIHELKTWPEPFEALELGIKHHEVRTDDRGFKVGDLLSLREWDPATGQYTGRGATRRVTYITGAGQFGLPAGLCVMSVVPIYAGPESAP